MTERPLRNSPVGHTVPRSGSRVNARPCPDGGLPSA